jgi:peptide chain release factor subunit 1
MITEEQIGRILRLTGDGLPVLSLYVRVPDEPDLAEVRTRANSLLSEARTFGADHSVERNARLSVRSDVSRIEEYLEGWQEWRPGGLAFFCCSGHDFFEAVELPRAVHDRIVLDETPWVRSLLAVLDQYRRMCVVTLERGTATVWALYQDELREITQCRDQTRVPRRVPALEEEQAHHKAEGLTRRHFRRVVELLDDRFREVGFDLLAVGGHPHELPEFIGLLPRHLRELVAGTFPLDPHATGGTARVHDHALEILQEHISTQQRQRVAEVLETAAAGGRAALGVEDCLWAAVLAAIDSLLVEDGVVRPGVVCDNCGAWMALEGEECPQCGHQLRHTVDVLDELVERVIDEGGSIVNVTVPTDLTKYTVGASLRFALPPAP